MTYTCRQCGFTTTNPAAQCTHCWSREMIPDRGGVNKRSAAVPLSKVSTEEKQGIPTGVPSLDKVLTRGYVRGYSILFSGDRGTGKSSLALEAMLRYMGGAPSIYATSEEAKESIASRGKRLDLASRDAVVYAESVGERIIDEASRGKYRLAVFDSVQTTSFGGHPFGSVQAGLEFCMAGHRWAQETGAVAIFICQENKAGQAAGAEALQHIVDAVLSLRLERMHETGPDNKPIYKRVLECQKNRQGAAPIQCDLIMTEKGLVLA